MKDLHKAVTAHSQKIVRGKMRAQIVKFSGCLRRTLLRSTEAYHNTIKLNKNYLIYFNLFHDSILTFDYFY